MDFLTGLLCLPVAFLVGENAGDAWYLVRIALVLGVVFEAPVLFWLIMLFFKSFC